MKIAIIYSNQLIATQLGVLLKEFKPILLSSEDDKRIKDTKNIKGFSNINSYRNPFILKKVILLIYSSLSYQCVLPDNQHLCRNNLPV